MQHLNTQGYVVLPILNEKNLKNYHDSFLNELKFFPEYHKGVERFVFSNFGGLSNPSAYHNPTVRILRYRISEIATPLFKEMFPGKYLQQLFDRMGMRLKGTAPSRELWHRDIACGKKDDITFGGWVNLDLNSSQYFSCIPKSHIEKGEWKSFSKLNKEEIKKYDQHRCKVEIPPGHWIIFYSNIIHEVYSKKNKIDNIRLYITHRISEGKEPLYDNEIIMRDQSVPPLPGGYQPGIWEKLHDCFHKNKLRKWKEETFVIPIEQLSREMKSLRYYGFPLYPEYQDIEKVIMNPRLL